MRNSSVPARRSSLHMRMVSAETRKMRRTGIHSKSGRTSAMFLAKKRSTQKKMNSSAAKKTAMKMKAAGEEKREASSLRAMRKILDMGRSPPVAARRYLGEHGLKVALLRIKGDKLKPTVVDGARDLRRHLLGGIAVQNETVDIGFSQRRQHFNLLHQVQAGD